MADGGANMTVQAISQANSLFTFDIYQNLANGTNNLFFSPLSIQVTLGLVFMGACGDTAKQLAMGLRLPEHKNVTEDGIRAIMHQLEDSNYITINIANRIFVQNGFNIKEEFNNSATRFKAGAVEVDFSKEKEVMKTINDWMKNRTHQKIKNIIPPGVLNDLTRMVLVNTIYFKGVWLYKFTEDFTHPEPFHLASGSTQNVDMMTITEYFKYSEISEQESQVVLLPYEEERFSMMIILPREQNGLPNLEKKLASINLQDILSGMRKRVVHVLLPRLKLEYQKELSSTLQTLGMTDMFDAERANLTGISDEPLTVSKVLHKAFIEINEEGTEAAAATFVDDVYRTALSSLTPHVTFKADHPFMFLILDQQTNTVLFAGRFSTPS